MFQSHIIICFMLFPIHSCSRRGLAWPLRLDDTLLSGKHAGAAQDMVVRIQHGQTVLMSSSEACYSASPLLLSKQTYLQFPQWLLQNEWVLEQTELEHWNCRFNTHRCYLTNTALLCVYLIQTMWRSASFIPLNLWLPEGGADTVAFGINRLFHHEMPK